LVRRSFFESIEVFAVEVLDQRLFEGTRILDGSDESGNGLEPHSLRRPPATLASDDLKLAALKGTNEDGLQQAEFSNRGAQGDESLLVEIGARLTLVRANPANGNLLQGRRTAVDNLSGGDQCPEAFT
jgi:hypothetical protein